MCGITGFWQATHLEPEAESILKTMTGRLHHRGPDGQGYYVHRKHGLGIGHARLSVIDLETGQQPLVSPDEKRVLAVNGEFYDYKRIRANLVCAGATFRTKSDSEIALPLYERYGLDFIHHLRGEFALALFDHTRQRLILARDRFGIRPLFYTVHNGSVYFGSEIKALFGHPKVPRGLCPRGVLHQLMHTMVPGTSTFESIHAVEPGQILVMTQGQDGVHIQRHQYWDMDFPSLEEREHEQPAEAYIEQLREQLIEAVHLRLEADVPVGSYLSGGIDSCSMLGVASSVQQSPIKAFTISFDHDTYDEAPIAREMAQRVQADHEILHLKSDDLYGPDFVSTLWHAERAFYNTLGVAKLGMSRRVRECGYKVVITGEGADELFGGYPAFKQDFYRHDVQGVSSRERAAYAEKLEQTNAHFIGAILAQETQSHPVWDKICGFTPAWIQPWIHTLSIGRPLLHDDVLETVKNYDPLTAIAEALNQDKIGNRHPLDVAQYTWIKTMLEGQILNWGGDRVDMANGMESRPAFLDHRVAEMARTIPPRFRIHQNIEKWILREAMRPVLPERLYRREKVAFMAPPAHTQHQKRKGLEVLMDRFLSRDHIKTVGLFDPERLSKFIADYHQDHDPASLTRKDALLNHVLGIHVLHHQFIQQP